MKNLIILLAVCAIFSSCKKNKEKEKEDPASTNATTDKKIYCIYYLEGSVKKSLECGEMTSQQAASACTKYRDQGKSGVTGEVRNSCSSCP